MFVPRRAFHLKGKSELAIMEYSLCQNTLRKPWFSKSVSQWNSELRCQEKLLRKEWYSKICSTVEQKCWCAMYVCLYEDTLSNLWYSKISHRKKMGRDWCDMLKKIVAKEGEIDPKELTSSLCAYINIWFQQTVTSS